jgi:hypothetical protein
MWDGRCVAVLLLTSLLQDEFGSVLDESLIILIADDRDLATDYPEIRDVLSQLAESAPAEAATGFDPSGLSSADIADIADLVDDPSFRQDPASSGAGPGSSAGSATTVSDCLDQSGSQRLTSQTNLSDDQKIQELKLVFGGRFRDNTLSYILKHAGGDLERAFDELLSRQYLEDDGCLPKGVDGFAAPDDDGPPAKGKAGRAQKGNGKAKKRFVEVDYKAVSSAAADEDLEGADHFPRPAASRGATTARRVPPPASAPVPAPATTIAGSSPVGPDYDFGAADLRAASKLRRMGPLGRQGAVVYVERAREAREVFTAQMARAAEAQVNHQSTDTMLDLHGVFVMDGVRIAKQRVWTWWNNLGESRTTLARQNGFTIVTGVGKHSVGGVSRLRQAVGAYLENDGWKVETLTGRFHVTGRL